MDRDDGTEDQCEDVTIIRMVMAIRKADAIVAFDYGGSGPI